MDQNAGTNTIKRTLEPSNSSTLSSRHHHVEEEAINEDEEPPIFSPGFRFYSAISVFMVMTVLESINSTSTSTALPSLSTKIIGSSSQYEWIGNAYMLASSALQIPIAALSDAWGRKPLILGSFILFAAGAISCALSQNIQTMLAGRTLQGIGGAGTLVLPEVFIADIVPLRLRGHYYALLSIMWSLGSALGPIIGGGFTTGTSEELWRWIFWINVPIIAVALLVTPCAVRLKSPQWPLAMRIRQFDYGGAILLCTASSSLILGLSMGGTAFPWISYQVLLPLILGILGFACVVLYELYIPTRPMISVRVMKSGSAAIGFIHVAVQGTIMEGLPYWLPIYYQGVKGYTPLISGIALLPFASIIFPASIASGWLVTKWGRYRTLSIFGWSILSLGLGLLQLLDIDTSVGQWVAITIPISLGLGILYSLQGILVQAPNPPYLWTDAAAMMSFTRAIGEALGVALGGSIFSSRMGSLVQGVQGLPTGVDPHQAIEIVEVIRQLPNGPLRSFLKESLLSSTQTIYIVYLVLAGVCLALNLLLHEYTLDRTPETKQGLKEYPSSGDSMLSVSTSHPPTLDKSTTPEIA